MRWQRFHFEHETSILTILCDSRFAETGWQALLDARKRLEAFILQYPEFEQTHHPWNPHDSAPSLIVKMCQASHPFNIGPMAAVAGALAEICLLAILDAGAKEAIVDNGGDIALFLQEPALIGLYAGTSRFQNMAFRIPETIQPLGICTSSGKIGHSFSYGQSDAAIVFSENIPLADCAATALGNQIHDQSDLETCFRIFDSRPEITGAAAIIDERISLYGTLPEIIPAEVPFDLITRGEFTLS